MGSALARKRAIYKQVLANCQSILSSGARITDITLTAVITGMTIGGDQNMSTVGVWGPSSGLSQFLSSLATSGTSSSRPISPVGLSRTSVTNPNQPADGYA